MSSPIDWPDSCTNSASSSIHFFRDELCGHHRIRDRNRSFGSAAYEVALRSEHRGLVATSLDPRRSRSARRAAGYHTLAIRWTYEAPLSQDPGRGGSSSRQTGPRGHRPVWAPALILRWLVHSRRPSFVYHRRAGGQSQYSTLLDLDANPIASKPPSLTQESI